jgi:hypothetical protein
MLQFKAETLQEFPSSSRKNLQARLPVLNYQRVYLSKDDHQETVGAGHWRPVEGHDDLT